MKYRVVFSKHSVDMMRKRDAHFRYCYHIYSDIRQDFDYIVTEWRPDEQRRFDYYVHVKTDAIIPVDTTNDEVTTVMTEGTNVRRLLRIYRSKRNTITARGVVIKKPKIHLTL